MTLKEKIAQDYEVYTKKFSILTISTLCVALCAFIIALICKADRDLLIVLPIIIILIPESLSLDFILDSITAIKRYKKQSELYVLTTVVTDSKRSYSPSNPFKVWYFVSVKDGPKEDLQTNEEIFEKITKGDKVNVLYYKKNNKFVYDSIQSIEYDIKNFTKMSKEN